MKRSNAVNGSGMDVGRRFCELERNPIIEREPNENRTGENIAFVTG